MIMGMVEEKSTRVPYTSEDVYQVGNEPVMSTAVEILSKFAKKGILVLKARGNNIPNAVAVANILTEKMMRGNSKIKKIHVDSEPGREIGMLVSTIEIILVRN